MQEHEVIVMMPINYKGFIKAISKNLETYPMCNFDINSQWINMDLPIPESIMNGDVITFDGIEFIVLSRQFDCDEQKFLFFIVPDGYGNIESKEFYYDRVIDEELLKRVVYRKSLINHMMFEEPKLKDLYLLVDEINRKAEDKEIFWASTWVHDIKPVLKKYVGFNAQDKRWKNSYDWDMWHDFLHDITDNLS